MNKLTRTLLHLAALLLFIGLTANTAKAADFYAAPNGVGVACTVAAPCSIGTAVSLAANGDFIYLRVPQIGAIANYQDNLVGAQRINKDVTFDSYVDTPALLLSVDAVIELDGDIIIGQNDTVTMADAGAPAHRFEFHMVGQPATLQMRQGAAIDGPGEVWMSAVGGSHTIQLGDPTLGCVGASVKTGTIQNLVIDKQGGTVKLLDQCNTDLNRSALFITNLLDIRAGEFTIAYDEVWLVGPTNIGPMGGMNISAGASMNDPIGNGVLFIAVDPAALGGPPNTRTGAYKITGGGVLSIAFDKITDAGVAMTEVPLVGAGGISYNRAGNLYVQAATVFNGTFRNEFAARTEFWTMETIGSNLEVEGPGAQTFPGGGATCDTSTTGSATGSENDSGVYFYAAVNVQGDVEMIDTDDPTTTDCVEGIWFMSDATPAAAAKTALHQPHSTFEDNFTADVVTPGGANGIRLTHDDFVHNLALEGQITFDESPIFVLDDPADAGLIPPAGNQTLCAATADYEPEADGNKVIFSGGTTPQNLLYNTPLEITSVQIEKDAPGQLVTIDPASAPFQIGTSLEVMNGELVTNALLDANTSDVFGPPDPDGGATISINRDASDVGVLNRGSGPGSTAYLLADLTYPENLPRKVKYVGTVQHFTADEIPGNASGSLSAGGVVTLQDLELFANPSAAEPLITMSKDFTLERQLRLTYGRFSVGSADIILGDGLQIAVGNGDIEDEAPVAGELIFPGQTGHPVADVVDNIGGIDLLYFGTETPRDVAFEWPTTAEDPDVIRNVEVNRECAGDLTIVMQDDHRANPQDGLALGTLNSGPGFNILDDNGANVFDVNCNTLTINASNGVTNDVFVATGADLTDSCAPLLAANVIEARDEFKQQLRDYTFALRQAKADETVALPEGMMENVEVLRAAHAASKAQTHAGLLLYTGGSDTDTFIETSNATGIGPDPGKGPKLRFDFPAIEVDKPTDGHATFDATGVWSTTVDPLGPNEFDVLGTPHFTLREADLRPGADGEGDGLAGVGGVELLGGLDILDIGEDYTQFDGEFLMAGVSSVAPPGIPFVNQKVSVGRDFNEFDGEFFTSGGDVEVFGDFNLGEGDTSAPVPSDALFSLAVDGVLSVVGDFFVSEDTDPAEQPGGSPSGTFNPLERNRFYNGDGTSIFFGDYYFAGTGDRFDDFVFFEQEQGLSGVFIYAGDGPPPNRQSFWMRQDEDAFLPNVEMQGDAGLILNSDAWQHDFPANGPGGATLLLKNGIIDTNDETFEWTILNPEFEPDLALRNNSAEGKGVVQLGSRNSYINGFTKRVVEFGNATGGLITGGYLFPSGAPPMGTDDPRDVDFFRPLMLQFPDDLGKTSVARVDYRQDFTYANLDFGGDPVNAAGEFAAPLVVPAGFGTELELDVVGNQFWQLEFDERPAFDPNIRVEAASLPNIFDITRLRLIQWDCVRDPVTGRVIGGESPQLAGEYDVDADPTDDPSFFLNDFIDGVPNLTQEGVEVNDCQIIGIAANFLENQINIPELPNGIARVQVIHNSPDAGPVDVFIDGALVLDDFEFQTATPFVPVPGGTRTVEIKDGTGTTTVFSADLTLRNRIAYVVVANGLAANLDVVVQEDVRLASTTSDVEFFVIGGTPGVGPVDLRLLDPTDNNSVIALLDNNVDFGRVGSYLNLPPGGYNIEVTNADNSVQFDVFRFNLNAFGSQSAVFVTSTPPAGSGATGPVWPLGFDIFGNPITPSVITSTEVETELPTEFTLEGNYPNPFNPSTTLQFDLPETAEVTVQIVDVLGRNVMTIPAQTLEAGANRTLQVNAASLASGTYLYRVIARTATDTMMKTGRMTLVK